MFIFKLPQEVSSSASEASPPNNLLIFDMFTVLENTFEQLAIMKQTSYSIATHVAFWTAAAQSDPRIRVVSIEYLLDLGHTLTDVKLSVNNGSLASVSLSGNAVELVVLEQLGHWLLVCTRCLLLVCTRCLLLVCSTPCCFPHHLLLFPGQPIALAPFAFE